MIDESRLAITELLFIASLMGRCAGSVDGWHLTPGIGGALQVQ